jgi:polysaccharide biosynthesis/export protein
MLPKRLQKLAASIAYYGVIVSLLSTTLPVQFAQAQSLEALSSIDEMIKNLETLGGKAGQLKGQFGVDSAIDNARSDAAAGFARSPFSRPDDSEYEKLDTHLSLPELMLIERYCRNQSSAGEERILRVMAEFSHIERDFCRRLSDRVLQIGYGVFDGIVKPELLVNGAIGDDYVLGIADELVLTYEGKKNDSITVHVDREGHIVHKDVGRIRAAGKTFGLLRQELKRLTRKSLFGTEVFVSMGSVRQVAVRVTGEVRRPGLHQITGLSSVFDALSLAGGIKKTGSLRRVQVQRGDRLFWVDVYELLYPQIGQQDLVVRDGDHILVPAIGHTIAIAGDVRRPGIFELAEGKNNISVSDALELAGGYIRPKGNALSRITFDASGLQVVEDFTDSNLMLDDGDIFVVKRRNNSTVGIVSVFGQVTNPGQKTLATTPTVSSLLLSNNSFKNNPYLLFGALETTDPSTFARRYFPINLQDIVSGKKDYALRDKDRLIVFSQEEIRYLSSDEVRRIVTTSNDPSVERALENEGEKVNQQAKSLAAQLLNNVNANKDLAERISTSRQSDALLTKSTGSDANGKTSGVFQYSCLGLRSLATILKFTRSGRFASVVQAMGDVDEFQVVNPRPCPEIFHVNPDLLPFLLEHSVAVNGEVRTPGAFPVTSGTPISSLLAIVGGMTLDADISRVEISKFNKGQVSRQNFNFKKTSMHDVDVNPGDVARFNPMFKARDSGPVLLSGEFVRPGLYDIQRGERLSEVFARAGGVTGQAYPYGAVFTRERVRVAEKAAFQRAARELKSAAMYSAGKAGTNTNALLALQNLTDEIANTETVGRVVIEADPTVLQVRPELDTVLEPGDRIYMPKRPNSVLVVGDILNPGALQFISGTKIDEYVQQAGGLQISADEDRMFLVYPNGVAQPVSVSVWNYNPVQVPPGSTVVVPKDPVPINLFEFAKDMTTLLSQMAITAASLAVIGNN